jgi:hypothetical protein
MRRHDWAAQMYAQFDAHADRVFAWGENDCCLFVARTVDAMTGSSLTQQLASEYRDEVTALQFISDHGGLEIAVSSFLGDPQPVRAMRGDAVMVHGGLDLSMGICAGPYVLAMGEKGLTKIDRREILKVWKV